MTDAAAGPGAGGSAGAARSSTDMVAKALSLLDLLGEYPHGAALSDLATRSGFPLSTTHRLLASLIRGGFASSRTPTGDTTSGCACSPSGNRSPVPEGLPEPFCRRWNGCRSKPKRRS